MSDDELKAIAWRGIAAFQRLIGEHAPGGGLAETPHYVASAVPEVSASIMNAAVPLEQASLAPHVDELAEFYADTPKWGAWIDPSAAADVEALTAHGLLRDSTPVLMATELDAVEAVASMPAVERVGMDVVGAVNDLAYGLPNDSIGRALGSIPADVIHAFGTRGDSGDIVCVLVIQDVDQDAFVTFVATHPEHRGKRLASNLLARALREAKARGQRTTSLQASAQGQNVYARLGYRALGEVHLYEKRPAA